MVTYLLKSSASLLPDYLDAKRSGTARGKNELVPRVSHIPGEGKNGLSMVKLA
jgi:hypothetical protein